MSEYSQSSKSWIIFCSVLLSIFILLSIYNIHSIRVMDRRMQVAVSEYEHAIRGIETKLKNQDQDLMTEFYKLRLDWTNEKIELEYKKGIVDREIFRIYVFAGTFMIFGSIGIWSILQSLIKKSVYEHISNLTITNKKVIEKIIEHNEEEQKSKKYSNILLLSKDEDKNDEVAAFLTSMGFDKITSQTTNNTVNYKDYDLVILNRIDGIFDKDKAKEIVEKHQDVKFFDYVNDKKNHIKGSFNNIINHANKEVTLYKNLLDTLVVSEKIKIPKTAKLEA